MEEKDLLKKIQEQVKELVGDPDKLKADLKEGFATSLLKATEGLMSKEDFDKVLEDMTEKAKELSEEKAKELAADIEKLGFQIQAIQEVAQNQKSEKMTFVGAVEAALKESKLISINEGGGVDGEDLRQIKFFDTGRKSTPLMMLKAAVDMTTGASYAGVEVGSPFKTVYDKDRVLIPLNNDIHAMDVFPVLNIKDKYFGILVQSTYVDGTAVTAENTAAGQSSFIYLTKEFKVHKINTFYKVSEEQFDDVDFLLQDIGMRAEDSVKSQFDERVYSATGDGDSDIKGLFVAGNFTAFASATYEDSTEDADLIDLIGKMKLQATVTNFNPNFVQMHPNLIDVVEGLKDLNANSKFNRSVKYDDQGNISFIKGMRVIQSKKFEAEAIYVGDNKAAKIGLRKNMTMQIGLDSDDLTKGMRTIVFGMRATIGVLQAGALIYTDTALTDVSTINKV